MRVCVCVCVCAPRYINSNADKLRDCQLRLAPSLRKLGRSREVRLLWRLVRVQCVHAVSCVHVWAVRACRVLCACVCSACMPCLVCMCVQCVYAVSCVHVRAVRLTRCVCTGCGRVASASHAPRRYFVAGGEVPRQHRRHYGMPPCRYTSQGLIGLSRVLSCPVVSCPVLSCRVLSCPVLSCPVVSCRVLSCPVVSCWCRPKLSVTRRGHRTSQRKLSRLPSPQAMQRVGRRRSVHVVCCVSCFAKDALSECRGVCACV